MVTQQLNSLLWHVRQIICPADSDIASDAELVQRFVDKKDESAFELLVRRHGPMVWHVCRRLLSRTQDAEDAFQATFLVLATKAPSIRNRQSLGSWLYKVAYNAALRTRKRTAQRSKQEQPLPETLDVPGQSSVAKEVENAELNQVLMAEIGRLPKKYRRAFVLCFLEGNTNQEAAKQLGCPKGTVLSRLSRAREWLRQKLARRGWSLDATAFAELLEANRPTVTALTPVLVSTTVYGAVLCKVQGLAATELAADVTEVAKATLAALSVKKKKEMLVGFILLFLLTLFGVLLLGRSLAPVLFCGDSHHTGCAVPTTNAPP